MTDLAFIEAIIVWLSDFPNSPLSPGDPFQILADRDRLFELTYALCGSKTPSQIEQPNPRELMLAQIRLNDYSTQIGGWTLTDYLDSMPFEDLFQRKSISSIVFLCKFLYLFSTRVSKYVPFAITSLGFLEDAHIEAINDFFAGDVHESTGGLIEKMKRVRNQYHEFVEIRDLIDEMEGFVSDIRCLPIQKQNTRNGKICRDDMMSSDCNWAKATRTRATFSRESCSFYVDEDELEALKWELKLTEDVLYDVTEKARKARIKLQLN